MRQFFDLILPNQGLYCLAILRDKYFSHYVYETKEEFIEGAKKYNENKQDVYFAVGSLKNESIYNEKLEKIQVRTKENISHFRSLIFDIDCGEEKPYRTKQDAILALKNFCTSTRLPKPIIVDSGGGLHVYWPFDRDVDADTWEKFANRLKAMARYFELAIDPVRTADKSSMLRVPETSNWKKEIAREVKVITFSEPSNLLEFANIIEKSITHNKIEVKQIKSYQFKNVDSNLIDKVDGNKVVAECKQLQYCLENSAEINEPLWFRALQLSRFFEEPIYEELTIGREHRKNNNWQAKIDQLTNSNMGPTNCDTFNDKNDTKLDICLTCPHWGKITSPIQLAKFLPVQPEIVEENIIDDVCPPPFPYARTRQGITKSDSEDEPNKIIYEYDLYPFVVIDDNFTKSYHVKIFSKAGMDKSKIFTLELEDIYDPKNFHRALLKYGVVVNPANIKDIYSYMMAYIKMLQSKIRSANYYGQLGWIDDGEAFVLPDKKISRNGEEASSISSNIKTPVEFIRKKGTLEEWVRVIDNYNIPGFENYIFGHLIGYGSLLFYFTPHNGAIVNMVGEGGSGKSTVLKTINSMFGHPEEAFLANFDTPMARYNRIGIMGNLCATYDEITEIEPDKLSELCYSISQGRTKLRLNQDSTEKTNTNRWKLILASTSNTNLTHKLSQHKADSSAQALRLFEFYINRKNVLEKDTFDSLYDNFGHAGEVFIKEVMKDLDGTKKLIKEMTAKFDKEADVPNQERFWSAIVGCCIAGGIIAKRAGLHHFDIDEVFNWAVSQVKKMRIRVEELVKDPRTLLVDYINSSVNNTFYLTGEGNMAYPYDPKSQLWNRCEFNKGLFYIDRAKIRDFLVKAGADFLQIKRSLLDAKILISDDVDKVLPAGSNMIKSGQTRCWLINLNTPEMNGVALAAVKNEPTIKLEGFKEAKLI